MIIPSRDLRYLRVQTHEKLVSCILSPEREILPFPSSVSELTGAQESDRPRDGGDKPEFDNGQPASQKNNSSLTSVAAQCIGEEPTRCGFSLREAGKSKLEASVSS